MNMCPFCGKFLSHPINDGITSCQNCNRVFDDSPRNRLFAAAWEHRKNHLMDMGYLQTTYRLTDLQMEMIEKNADRTQEEWHILAKAV